jgi:hypothetical protein
VRRGGRGWRAWNYGRATGWAAWHTYPVVIGYEQCTNLLANG